MTKIHISEEQEYKPGEGLPGAPATPRTACEPNPSAMSGHGELAILIVRLHRGIELLENLRKGLPQQPSVEMRESLIRLLYGAHTREADEVVQGGEPTNEIIESQIDYLAMLGDNFQALLDSLPAKLTDEADNALIALASRFNP